VEPECGTVLPPHTPVATAKLERPTDCQVDCQPHEPVMDSLDGGGRVQVADLLIWMAMDRSEHAGKS
jgi:hypothetical protein